MIGLYLHIPFCRTRCPYCDFVSNAIPGSVPGEFADALCREIAAFNGPSDANTIFFGGGTPSLLAPAMLETLLRALRDRFEILEPEITIEANPDDVTAELADAWAALGVNRVSFGVQSFDDEVLRYLERRHDAESARRACAIISERFDNSGMDLIFGAHPTNAWEATLDACLAYAPKHVSTYGLTYEPGTPFGDRQNEAINDDIWLELYRLAHAKLVAYDHYEISNYALPGYQCRHNLIYWKNEEYAGFGPAAYSFIDGVRSRNHIRLDDYCQNPGAKSEAIRLTDREIRTETVIQHLRLREGLAKQYYRDRFQSEVRNDFGPTIAHLLASGLIEEDETHLCPTRSGFELNNEIGLALVG